MSEILTIEQAQSFLQENGYVTTISITIDGIEVFFFPVSQYCPKNSSANIWVPIAERFTTVEYHIEQRYVVSTESVRDIACFIKAFLRDTKIVQSEKELIEFFTEEKSRAPKVVGSYTADFMRLIIRENSDAAKLPFSLN